MQIFRILLIGVFAIGAAACGKPPQPQAPPAKPAGPTAADVGRFIQQVNDELRKVYKEDNAANWVAATYITQDTEFLRSKADERALAKQNEWYAASKQYRGVPDLSPQTKRALDLLRLNASAAPTDPKKLAELTEIGSRMEASYGAGKYCPKGPPKGPDSCKNLDELSKTLAKSRDYDALLDAWRGWRTVSVPMRQDYARFVELSNEGARDLGFADTAELWQSRYDMPPAEFRQETERLWGQVKPLYAQLQCYVRGKLEAKYGKDKAAHDGMIEAHLLGNMWAQEWNNIDDLVEPYPGAAPLDVNTALEKQKWDARRMTQSAESFYENLGFPKLPDGFYERSMLTRPRDRDVVCHASAWDLDMAGDVRVKVCLQPTEEDLATIYHELGHIFYFRAYNGLPPLFQNGAHDGVHEAVGDTMRLALTPAYLHTIGLVPEVKTDEKAMLNQQMKLALEKVAFLPFGKLIDEWRWRVFTGEITPENYNAAWWKLREQYQGVAPPVARSESDFDPGAKYHVAANVPYMRYFLADILQFQFYKAMCDAAGYQGPLSGCSFAGSKESGAKLRAMLSLGQSVPWPEALEKLTGSRKMDAGAIVEYFEPLMKWMKQQNEGQACGWQAPG